MIVRLTDPSVPISLGIPHDNNHIFFSWDGLVFFSATQRGDAMECHLSSTRTGKRWLRVAVNQFCEYVFSTYTWCGKITACVKIKSVKNLCLNCGFEKFFDYEDSEVFVRWAI